MSHSGYAHPAEQRGEPCAIKDSPYQELEACPSSQASSQPESHDGVNAKPGQWELLANHLSSCIMWWIFSMHKEAYFVLDLSVTLAILTLLFNLFFLNFPVTMEESYVPGCNTSGREVKIRAVIFVHCLSLWQIPSQSTLHPCLRKSFLLSQHSSFAYLSKALSNRGVVGFHTQDASGSPSFSARFLPMLWSGLCNFCCFESERLFSKLLSAVSQSLVTSCVNLWQSLPSLHPSGVLQLQHSHSMSRRWWHYKHVQLAEIELLFRSALLGETICRETKNN